MAPGCYVLVPEDLGRLLVEDGFSESGFTRGAETWAEVGVSTTANLVTIFVARHEVARFVSHLWDHARRRGSDHHQTRIVAERDGRRLVLTLEQEGFGTAGPPLPVVQGLSALLAAMDQPDPT
jgi:hypothetical protein